MGVRCLWEPEGGRVTCQNLGSVWLSWAAEGIGFVQQAFCTGAGAGLRYKVAVRRADTYPACLQLSPVHGLQELGMGRRRSNVCQYLVVNTGHLLSFPRPMSAHLHASAAAAGTSATWALAILLLLGESSRNNRGTRAWGMGKSGGQGVFGEEIQSSTPKTSWPICGGVEKRGLSQSWGH